MNLLPLFAFIFAATANAAAAVIPISADQARTTGIVTAPLASLESRGGRTLPGQVVVPPAQLVVINSPLDAVVTEVKVAYGDSVKRGQLLARLQGPQLLELQRQFSDARAQADVAAEARRRDETLFAEGIISRSRLAVTQAAERQAAALLSEKRNALRLADMPLPDAGAGDLSGVGGIRAPFDATVLEAPAQVGQRTDAATPLFRLGKIDRLWLEIQASPAQAAGLAPGDPVRVSGCNARGTLTLVSPHLNPATQALLLRADFPNPGGCLVPFQFVQAQVDPSSRKAGAKRSWRVPSAAVVRNQGRVWLLVATPGGFNPAAVRIIDEAEQTVLVDEDGAAVLDGSERIAVGGTAAIKAAWLGIGTAAEQ